MEWILTDLDLWDHVMAASSQLKLQELANVTTDKKVAMDEWDKID